LKVYDETGTLGRLSGTDATTYDGFGACLEGELDRGAASHPNPGRTPDLHRLNRAEHRNVIRDLLALEIDTAMLPADGVSYGFDQVSYGFDNVASASRISKTRLEQYLPEERREAVFLAPDDGAQ